MQKYFYLTIFLVATGCCICLSFIEARATDSSSPGTVDTSLSQLEDRFFEHQYDSDTDIDRLNRIEEFVYGSHQSGSVNERIKRVLSTIPDDASEQDTQNTSPQPTSNNTNQPASQSHKAVTDVPQVSPSPSNAPFDYGSYPRVANLEQELLGHPYPNDSLPDRLSRLETKAYGAPSSNTDLCQRVDLLDDYAQRHDLYGDHQSINRPSTPLAFAPTKTIAPGTDDDQDSSTDIPPSRPQQEYSGGKSTFVGSAEERVSMMEAQVFHHTSTDKPLDQRLKKLEKRFSRVRT